MGKARLKPARSKNYGTNLRVSKRRVLIFTGIILYLVFSAGCGIQSFPYLAPIEIEDITRPAPGEKRFLFINNTENNPIYLQGYEIYYKFYSTDPYETVTALNYEKHTESINDRIEANGVTIEEIQTTYGYYRLYANDTDLPIPLLPLSESQKDDPIIFELDFSIIAVTIYPTAKYLSSDGIVLDSIELARYVEKEDQVTAGPDLYNFTPDELISEYDDFSKDLDPGHQNEIYLSLYVATYGKSSPFDPGFYSFVAHLGAVKLETTSVQVN